MFIKGLQLLFDLIIWAHGTFCEVSLIVKKIFKNIAYSLRLSVFACLFAQADRRETR